MSNSLGLRISRPISLWNRPLKADFKKLFIGLTKAVSQVALMNWGSAIKEAIEAVSVIGLEKDAGQVAWLLIYRSILQAIYTVVEENLELIRSNPQGLFYLRNGVNPNDLASIVQTLNLSLENDEFVIDEELFSKPAHLAILRNIKEPFFQWLHSIGLSKPEAGAVSSRLPTYFVYALNDQWRTYRQDYELLREALNTPFTKAGEREQAWTCYFAWLQKQVEEPMFYEAFSLNQLYIPLRAYFERKTSKNRDPEGDDESLEFERVVVDLNEELKVWLQKTDLQDSIRVISGGPGSGKSSFSKIFAATQCENRERPVLFIPLHRFDPADDLVESVGRFVQYDGMLPHNPLDPQNGEARLFIVFDGLDELSMQGRIAADIAQRFVQEVHNKVNWFNSREPRLKVLISGRELAVQANASEFRKPKQVLHILPYFLPGTEARTYIDPGELLRLDKYDASDLHGRNPRDHRHRWWTTYGRLTGKRYVSMPSVLEREALQEVTSQPLLNYLVALSYGRGKVDFTQHTNVNLIYEDLLDAVYQRAWAENQHPAIAQVSQEDFVRILEEIAISAWHGDSRTTSVKEIEEHCVESGMNVLLERFKEGFKEGIGNLLMAFYFRRFGKRSSGEEAFEFTHKSFGEYLAARRIVRGVKRTHEELARRRKSYDSGWDERDSLTNWVKFCGPTQINRYLFEFILNELELKKKENIQKWHQDLSRLVSFVLKQGIPFEKLETRYSFKEETRRSRNAEEAMLVVLSALAARTQSISKIEWENPHSFAEWIQRLRGVRTGNENAFALSCLERLDLRGCILDMQNFEGAVLDFGDLRNVSATHALFIGANLMRAKLDGGQLFGSKLVGASLNFASVRQANLQYASLHASSLNGANFDATDLSYADLRSANLFECKLRGTNLSGADLDSVNLHSADLGGANLENANLRKAILQKANLFGARIKGTNLSGVKFQGATWTDGRVIRSGSPEKFIFED